MYLKHLNIENFRAIKKAKLSFDSGINFLIGANNIGKSTILTAIDFLLNPYIQWWRNDRLSEFDFWRREVKNDLIIEAIICCGYKTCCGEEESCPYFEFEVNERMENCKLSHISLSFNKNDIEHPFPNVNEQEETEDLELAVKVRMMGRYQEEEDYIKVVHEIYGNDGEWHSFTRSMKEFIGMNLFTTIREPDSNFRLQYNSLLNKFFKNINKTSSKIINHFKDGLNPIIDEIYNQELKEFFEDHQDLIFEFPNNTSINLGLGKVRDSDILKQIELNLKYISEKSNNFEIPLSFQGRGLQNILFLFMCSRIQSIQFNSPKIFLIEEPEQNLEPQRQRSIVKIIKNLVKDDTQIIITTHSPYILTLNKNLNGVKKLVKKSEDELQLIDLGEISTSNSKKFNDIRKQCDSDFELFESLFSNFIVLWEGDCEFSFYNTIMRNLDKFPSEWLVGINCQGDNIRNISKWLKNAEYKILAIIDGDKSDLLSDLEKESVYFIALKDGEKFENIIKDCLSKLNDEDYCEVLISMIGAKGSIVYNNKIMGNWVAFKNTFDSFTSHLTDQNEKYRFKIDTTEFLRKFKEIYSQQSAMLPQFVHKLLPSIKEKRAYETLAEFLVEKQSSIDTILKLLEKLKNIFIGDEDFGFYQLSDEDEFQIR